MSDAYEVCVQCRKKRTRTKCIHCGTPVCGGCGHVVAFDGLHERCCRRCRRDHRRRYSGGRIDSRGRFVELPEGYQFAHGP